MFDPINRCLAAGQFTAELCIFYLPQNFAEYWSGNVSQFDQILTAQQRLRADLFLLHVALPARRQVGIEQALQAVEQIEALRRVAGEQAVRLIRREPDESAHRAFAKRTSEARGAIEQARTANGQAELDLMHATELAKVALDGLLAARAGADWRALEHARQARTDAAAGVGPAWEALRCAGLRIARADYELDRLVEEWLAACP